MAETDPKKQTALSRSKMLRSSRTNWRFWTSSILPRTSSSWDVSLSCRSLRPETSWSMVIDLEIVSASATDAKRLLSLTGTGGRAAFSALTLRSSSDTYLAPAEEELPVRSEAESFESGSICTAPRS